MNVQCVSLACVVCASCHFYPLPGRQEYQPTNTSAHIRLPLTPSRASIKSPDLIRNAFVVLPLCKWKLKPAPLLFHLSSLYLSLYTFTKLPLRARCDQGTYSYVLMTTTFTDLRQPEHHPPASFRFAFCFNHSNLLPNLCTSFLSNSHFPAFRFQIVECRCIPRYRIVHLQQKQHGSTCICTKFSPRLIKIGTFSLAERYQI